MCDKSRLRVGRLFAFRGLVRFFCGWVVWDDRTFGTDEDRLWSGFFAAGRLLLGSGVLGRLRLGSGVLGRLRLGSGVLDLFVDGIGGSSLEVRIVVGMEESTGFREFRGAATDGLFSWLEGDDDISLRLLVRLVSLLLPTASFWMFRFDLGARWASELRFVREWLPMELLAIPRELLPISARELLIRRLVPISRSR
jgi:hypothetical protein